MSNAVKQEATIPVEMLDSGTDSGTESDDVKAVIGGRTALHMLYWGPAKLPKEKMEELIMQRASPPDQRKRRRAAPVIEYEKLCDGAWQSSWQKNLWWREYVWHDVARIAETKRGHRLPPYREATRYMQAMLDATAMAIEERNASN